MKKSKYLKSTSIAKIKYLPHIGFSHDNGKLIV
jgi:hypothetical protein